MIQPAIKSIHENNKINKTKVPFTIIYNISEKKNFSQDIPRGSRFANEALCGERETSNR